MPASDFTAMLLWCRRSCSVGSWQSVGRVLPGSGWLGTVIQDYLKQVPKAQAMRGSWFALLVTVLSPAVGLSGQQALDDPLVRVMGFGDFNYLLTELDRQERFRMGQMVGHVIADIDEGFTFFGEVSVTGKDDGYSIEVERALVRYDFTDAFKISAGRFHTPVGYWNTAFHHGSWLQTSVARPEMIKFGSRFIPTHFVGIIVEGGMPASPLGLGYSLGVGNGRAANIARAGDAGDVNDQRAWVARVRSRPISFPGLELGVSFYSDRLLAPDGNDANERIYSVHGALDRDAPEILAEYAHVTHGPVTGSGDFPGSNAYYIQFGYRFYQVRGEDISLKPYVRVEQVVVPTDAYVFGPLGLNYDGLVVGVRYDPGIFLALRLEYRYEQFEGLETTNSLYAQASFVLAGS